MAKHSACALLSDDANPEPIYPADLTPSLQAELAALAAIDAHYADKLHRLETWAGPQDTKERFAREAEACRRRDREPHVLRLGELHERMMALTMFTHLRARH